MKISMIGLGKLGFPVALAWASKGHNIVGFDLRPEPAEIMRSRKYPHLEPGAQRLLDESVSIEVVGSVREAVEHGDIVFLAVETPHKPEYEGTTWMPEERADFSYEALKRAFAQVAAEAAVQEKHVVVVIISTALPGTCEREIVPIMNEHVSLVYAPMFIAQSTVVEDALSPEFVLLGVDKADARAIETVKAFFETMHPAEKLRFMSVASAEATKVAYNVFLGLKIVAANAWMEICHKTSANIDDVMDALAQATDRIVSPKYMRGGMSDGGGCHPRDQIALSWLAESLDLSFDIGGAMVRAREQQTSWLADLVVEHSDDGKLPIIILGKAYKRGTNLTAGSPAILLAKMLKLFPHLMVEQWDPFVDGDEFVCGRPAVFVIATDHPSFYEGTTHHPINMGDGGSARYPEGSVVIDPWGRMPDQDGVKVIRVGRSR